VTERRLLGAGAALLLLAVSPWMHGWADRELAVHMVQHLVLMIPVAGLFALGLSGRARVLLPPGPAWAAMTLAVLAHGAAVWFWHAPAPFDAAVEHPALHLLEHALLLVTAVWFWAAVVASVRADLPAVAVAGIFVVTLQGMALGALMALAGRPWYAGPSLSDQQVAGVVMWCPAGFAYLGVAAGVLLRWLMRQDREFAVVED
jgi:putative membrane protein